MIPVNAFSILQMRKIFLTYSLFFAVGFLCLPEGGCAVGFWGNPCDRMLRKNAEKLRQVSERLEQTVTDNYDSLLLLFNYAYSDTSVSTMRQLTEIQSELSCWTETSSSCAANVCLLLAESCFYQRDYENVRKYVRLMQKQNPDSSALESAELLLLRTAIAGRRWEEASLLLEKRLAKDSSCLTDEARAFTLLDADFRLQTTYGLTEKLDILCELGSYDWISGDLRRRVTFMKGQLLMSLDRMQEASRCFTAVLERCPAGAMFAYAYVYNGLCHRYMAAALQDSIDAELLRQSNRLPFEPTMVESCHDSDFIYSIYPYYFKDMASRFFLDEDAMGNSEDYSDTGNAELDETEYPWYDDSDTTRISPQMLSMVFDNWDSVSIHIPKADFSHLEDTLFLPLVDSGYQMPPFTAVTSEFGWRRYRYHYGVDTKNRTGDSIRCLFDGYVRIAKRNRTYGNVVVVRHLNGLETFYAHCSKLLVTQNQEVKAGDLIALVGSTGRSTGPHLHFETRYKGVPFNPRYMIDFDSNRLRSDTLKITKETFNYLKPYGGSGSTSSGAVYYKVRSGDTLSRIAQKNRTSVAAIKRLNGLRSDFIREGQRLRIR